MIDLHLHTTASDGLCEPAVLVDLAWRAGIRTMSVTDHDTVAALSEVERAATASRHRLCAGIEITAVHEGRDVHVLGYFFDRDDEALAAFLEQQRADRVRRVAAIADKLADMGKPVDRTRCSPRATAAGRSAGRWSRRRSSRPVMSPTRARPSISSSAKESPRSCRGAGPSPADVIGIIHRAGGVASLAHPGLLKRDDLIPGMIAAGLAAVEAFHSEHDAATTEHYLAFAERHGILVSGGSDYHGEKERRRGGVRNRRACRRDRFEQLDSARRQTEGESDGRRRLSRRIFASRRRHRSPRSISA